MTLLSIDASSVPARSVVAVSTTRTAARGKGGNPVRKYSGRGGEEQPIG